MNQGNHDIAKPDNLLGVCHAVGEAFGFNPLILRVAFVLGMLASAKYTIASYLVLGLAVGAAALVNRFSGRRAASGEVVAFRPSEASAEPERLAA